MGLFRRTSRAAEERKQWFPSAVGGGPLISAAYYNVPDVDRALCNAASWACIDVLADAIARTPLDVYRMVGDNRQPVGSTPGLIAKPSAIVAPDVWRYQLAWSLLTDGNAFGIITAWRNGWPEMVEWVNAAEVTQRGVKDGVPVATYDYNEHALFPHGDLFHIPGRMVTAGSPFGLSPVTYAAKSIGTSLGAEDYANSFFEAGGHQTAVLSSTNPDMTAEQASGIKAAWKRATSGNREPLVLGSGLTYTPIQSQPDSAGPVELMRFQVEQAARFWRVPPTMIYGATSGQSVTYANASQNDLAYLKHSLDGYYVRVEEALTAAVPRPQFVKANRNAILRADVAARFATYEVALRTRTKTVNEVRALEDDPPFDDPEFDEPGVPP
jgi:HK97 family phage portal protein